MPLALCQSWPSMNTTLCNYSNCFAATVWVKQVNWLILNTATVSVVTCGSHSPHPLLSLYFSIEACLCMVLCQNSYIINEMDQKSSPYILTDLSQHDFPPIKAERHRLIIILWWPFSGALQWGQKRNDHHEDRTKSVASPLAYERRMKFTITVYISNTSLIYTVCNTAFKCSQKPILRTPVCLLHQSVTMAFLISIN